MAKRKPMLAVLCDVETTGLVDNRTLPIERLPEIIEFYGCVADLETGKISGEFDTLVKPHKRPIPKEITKITGITDEDLENAPSFAEVAKPILEILAAAPVVIAHNAMFEKDMIEIEFERMKHKVTLPRFMCTIEQTMHIRGQRISLSNLHHYLFGEKFEGAHRARADVEAMLRCCVELRSRKLL